jgi:hypothetical protein
MDWFFCRECHSKRGDAIGFMQWIDGLSFIDACKKLDATIELNPTFQAKEDRSVTNAIPLPELIAKATVRIGRERANLIDNSEVRSYLGSRKLKPETWSAFGLGAAVLPLPGTWDKEKREACYPSQPCVAMPWVNQEGEVVGIRYRFIEKHTYNDLNNNTRKDVKIKSLHDSIFHHLFGWQAIIDGDKSNTVLFVVEGEINAMSIWQVAAEEGLKIDVLSIGSEGRQPTGLADHASGYAGVIVWADKPEVADGLMGALPGAFAVFSKDDNDANALLKLDLLSAYIHIWMETFGFGVAVATDNVPAELTERSTLVFEPGSVLYGPTDADANEYREWLWRRMQYDSAVKVDVATLRAHLNTGAEIEHPHADILRKAVIAPVETMTVDEYLDRLFGPSTTCPF